MAGLLNIGLTGLNAAQIQLNTASHNIANAGTPGYNRQGVVQSTNNPQFSGVGFFGQGTRIAGVERQYSQFLENQVLSADNRRSEFASYGAQISQINNLLADPSAGLSPAMQGFFAGVQEVAANPTSVAARQAMISNAQTLVTRFQGVDNRLNEIRQGVESSIGASVDVINSLAANIGEMNQRILVAQSAGMAVPANDLLDQRNQLVAELNQYVKTSTVSNKDGSLSVFIGSGQTLVLGQQVTRLAAVRDSDDPMRMTVAMVSPNGGMVPLLERFLTGGELGGLLAFRRESLDPTQNQLGLIAVAMAESFNAQHRLGQDLDGLLGQDFFKSPAVSVLPAGAVGVTIDPAAIGSLTASDYRIERVGAQFNVTRLADGKPFGPLGAGILNIDGLLIDPSGLANGESALIQPTRVAARDISVAITDVRKIAAGNPVSVETRSGNKGTSNVSDIVVRSVEGMASGSPHFPPVTLEFDANELKVRPPAPVGFSIDGDAAYDPATHGIGKRFTVTYTDGTNSASFDFRLAGVPTNDDAFTFSATEKGVADNRNASLLGALQTKRVLFDAGVGPNASATATLQSGYAQLVSQVGNKTREVQVGEQAQTTMLQQAQTSRDSLSGVNLDEEAANLIRYQQAYQASGRVMSIAQRLFDEVLSIAR